LLCLPSNSDFTPASVTAFQNREVRFIHVNVAEFDVSKNAALPLSGDALATIEKRGAALGSYAVGREYAQESKPLRLEWDAAVDRICAICAHCD
jgi:3D-(3,5/4)-trihydroxycyclohexane-1,2-dione acylhydrolase (decyclizing)